MVLSTTILCPVCLHKSAKDSISSSSYNNPVPHTTQNVILINSLSGLGHPTDVLILSFRTAASCFLENILLELVKAMIGSVCADMTELWMPRRRKRLRSSRYSAR
mmetsp:Transcript_17929/g.48719  ORF Transcript_17929/g.48719 Transcript_17929/m.48719 type:complete len:105 (+) Transcript_17929:379-693(+)